ncbi:MAG TPA: SMC-Scp complex subunit ScpB [Stellaceae bacterium]|jgi:segregation and condensation protein B|nr:SMC-Scp complex subunit ScpB [Stellaceae bacterium]
MSITPLDPHGESGAPEDVSVDAGDFEHERASALRLVEALLFATSEPLAETRLQEYLPEGLDVAVLLGELQQFYRFRGINLARVAGCWSFRTAPDLAGQLAAERVETRKLSRAQIETLAIVAYHQPVTRAEIEEIRGVALSKGTLDLLIEAGWIAPKGRRETPGRPLTWGTTDAFLQHFGLDSVTDLPRLEELRAAGLLDAQPAVSLGESNIDEGVYPGPAETEAP